MVSWLLVPVLPERCKIDHDVMHFINQLTALEPEDILNIWLEAGVRNTHTHTIGT